MVDPQKRAFLSFEIKTQKKFSSYFSFVLANNRRTNVILIGIFENAQKKTLLTAKLGFLTVNNFFCAFLKILTKRTFVPLLFLKLNQSQNTKKTYCWGVSFKNQKHTFSGGQNGTF